MAGFPDILSGPGDSLEGFGMVLAYARAVPGKCYNKGEGDPPMLAWILLG